jgi:hypothetical protein
MMMKNLIMENDWQIEYVHMYVRVNDDVSSHSYFLIGIRDS